MQIWMRLLFLHDFLSLSFLYPFLQVQWYLSPFPLTQSCWQPPLSLRSHGCTKQEEKKKKMLKSINILVRRSNNRPFVVEYYNWSVLFIGLYSYKTARQSREIKSNTVSHIYLHLVQVFLSLFNLYPLLQTQISPDFPSTHLPWHPRFFLSLHGVTKENENRQHTRTMCKQSVYLQVCYEAPSVHKNTI